MKTVYEHHINLPDYSLPYLINGDSSGLEPNDKIAIDSFMEYYYRLVKSGESLILTTEDDSEPYFSGCPPFGLPCNVVPCVILILAPETGQEGRRSE